MRFLLLSIIICSCTMLHALDQRIKNAIARHGTGEQSGRIIRNLIRKNGASCSLEALHTELQEHFQQELTDYLNASVCCVCCLFLCDETWDGMLEQQKEEEPAMLHLAREASATRSIEDAQRTTNKELRIQQRQKIFAVVTEHGIPKPVAKIIGGYAR